MHNVPHWKGSNAGIFVGFDILDLFLENYRVFTNFER